MNERSRVTRLEVSNFKRIVAVEIDLAQGVTEISGRNGHGKTSILDSIAVWLDGLKAAPAEPIHQGAERSLIRGRIGEMEVIRYIDRKPKGGGYTTKLMFKPVASKDGKPYPATQRQLDELIGEHQLDPLVFVGLDKNGKFDALRAFVPGFDFVKAAREHDADFSRRTDVNRLAKEARAAASLILVPEGTPEEPVDEQALVQELQEAGDANAALEVRRAKREAVARNRDNLRTQAAEKLARVEENAAAKRAQHDQYVAEQQERIEGLERQIAAIRDAINTRTRELPFTIERESHALRAEAEQLTAQADAEQKRLETAPPLPEPKDTVEISMRIEQARKTNQDVNRLAERRRHEQIATRYEAESAQLTEAMAARQRAKEQAIANAKLPIEGIGFGDGELLLNGVPFEQASTAQQLRVAIALIVARNPKLRLAWIRDASLLDDETHAEIQRLAAEYGCDILLETVRPIGQNVVVIEDGRNKAPDAQEPTEDAA